jgi:hypothetical protein
MGRHPRSQRHRQLQAGEPGDPQLASDVNRIALATSRCGMNTAFAAELTPAYFFLPDLWVNGWQLSRHDDIWGGYLVKKLMDRRGDLFAFGHPVVEHTKQTRLERVVVLEQWMHLMSMGFYDIVDAASAEVTVGGYTEMFAEFVDEYDRQVASSKRWRTASPPTVAGRGGCSDGRRRSRHERRSSVRRIRPAAGAAPDGQRRPGRDRPGQGGPGLRSTTIDVPALPAPGRTCSASGTPHHRPPPARICYFTNIVLFGRRRTALSSSLACVCGIRTAAFGGGARMGKRVSCAVPAWADSATPSARACPDWRRRVAADSAWVPGRPSSATAR